MVTRRQPDVSTSKQRPPAITPESREHQLVAMSIDLAEQQIRSGTASSQVITHFLKLGSTREQLEQERLRHENHLLEVKAEAIASAARQEELFEEAMKALKGYKGLGQEEEFFE